MNRRNFLRISLPTPLLAFGCADKSSGHPLARIDHLEDQVIYTYNTGDFENLETSFVKGCTFASDSIAGGFCELMRVLRVTHRRCCELELLPLSARSRTTSVRSDSAWSLIELGAGKEHNMFGHLTLVLREMSSGWQIVHYHFSQ